MQPRLSLRPLVGAKDVQWITLHYLADAYCPKRSHQRYLAPGLKRGRGLIKGESEPATLWSKVQIPKLLHDSYPFTVNNIHPLATCPGKIRGSGRQANHSQSKLALVMDASATRYTYRWRLSSVTVSASCLALTYIFFMLFLFFSLFFPLVSFT